jgi:hypothetical protein
MIAMDASAIAKISARFQEDFRKICSKICSKISVRSGAFGQRRRRCEATAAEPPSVLGERGFKRGLHLFGES